MDDVGAGFLVRRLGLLVTVGRRGVGHDGGVVGWLLGRGHRESGRPENCQKELKMEDRRIFLD